MRWIVGEDSEHRKIALNLEQVVYFRPEDSKWVFGLPGGKMYILVVHPRTAQTLDTILIEER